MNGLRAMRLCLAVYCLALVLANVAEAREPQVDLKLAALHLAEDSALVCEAGALLGGCDQAQADVAVEVPAVEVTAQQILFEQTQRLDLNRDGQLDHRELKILDLLSRRELLLQLDSNLDRQLSADEMPQPNDQAGTPRLAQFEYPNPIELSQEPPVREAYQNLRRYGIGLQPKQPAPRSQPFARAATFGSTSSYYRPTAVRATGRSSQAAGRSVFRPDDWRVHYYRPRLPLVHLSDHTANSLPCGSRN